MVFQTELLKKLSKKVRWVCFQDETANEFEAVPLNDILEVLVEQGIVKKIHVRNAGFDLWCERHK